MATSDADKFVLDGYNVSPDIEAGARCKLHLTCAHCEKEAIYPDDVIVMYGHYLRTGEAVACLVHRECEEPYRVACDKETCGG